MTEYVVGYSDTLRTTPSLGSEDGAAHLRQLARRLPADFQHLATGVCNPNLTDPWARKQGYMRSLRAHRQHTLDVMRKKRCGILRNLLGMLSRSRIMRFFIFLVILGDCILIALVELGVSSDRSQDFIITNTVVIGVLTADLIARLGHEGFSFFKSCMNLFEFIVTVMMLVELGLKQPSNSYVSTLRAIRPILRVAHAPRVLLRYHQSYFKLLRHQLSGDRVRFIQEGFDLDLAYIGGQILAMSHPSVGHESAIYNPYWDVAQFLNERHGNRYLLLNTTQSRSYPLKPFFYRYFHFPITQNSVPDLGKLYSLCVACDAFLQADPSHILAVHSHHGQGRTALIVIALLIYRGTCNDLESAIAYFERSRLRPENQLVASTQTFDCASQRRLLEYFLVVCRSENRKVMLETLSSRTVKFKRLSVSARRGLRVERILVYNYPSSPARVAFLGRTQGLLELLISRWRSLFDFTLMFQFVACHLAGTLRSRLKEGLFDTVPFGSLPLRGSNVILAKNMRSSQMPRLCRRNSPGSLRWSGTFSVALEEDLEVQISGMFRIEIYGSSTRGITRRDHLSPLQENEMLFSCWLHAGLLGLSALPSGGSESFETILIAVLGRNEFDKAVGAPPLHTYAENLRFEFEFEVDQRNQRIEPLAHNDATDASSSEHSEDLTLKNYSLGWLTWVFEKVWPFFIDGFEKLVREDVLPTLIEALPGPLKGVQLTHFSLGNARPRFGPVKASSGETTSPMEIQLDIFVSYETLSKIVLASGFAHLGICSMAFSGWMSLRFRTASTLPLVTSIQIFFVRPPDIQINFNKNVDVVTFKSLQHALHALIRRTMHKLMVLPNKLIIDWTTVDESLVSFKQSIPRLMTRVKIIGVRFIKSATLFLKHKPDTFVRITVGDQVAQTFVVERSSNPVWNMEYDFLVHYEGQEIDCRVFIVDFTGRSQLLGRVGLSVSEIVGVGQDGKWFCLENSFVEVLLRGILYDANIDTKAINLALSGAQSPSPKSCSRRAKTSSVATNSVSIDVGAEEANLDDSSGWDVGVYLVADEGATALMICEVFGCKISREIISVGSVTLEISLGSSCCCRPCEEVLVTKETDVQGTISRLYALGLGASAIADALGEELDDVLRFVRRASWNLKQPSPYCMLLQPKDLACTDIEVVLFDSKRHRVACTCIKLNSLLTSEDCSFNGSITCVAESRDALCVDVDLKIQIYYLTKRLRFDSHGEV